MTATRTIARRFYGYRLSVSNGFYLPLSILYLQQVRGFGLDQIGMIMGAFSFAMVVAEIPTGYIGDRLGRRTGLAVGNVLSAGFMFGYVGVQSPAGYLFLHVMWAFGWAFRSGTADAWLYELLIANGDASEFTRYRSRAMAVELAFEAVTALLAGVVAVTIGWAIPFVANGVIAALGLPLLMTSPSAPDTDCHPEIDDETPSIAEAIDVLWLQVGRPEVRWLVLYVAVFSGLYAMIRTFEQPVVEILGIPVTGLGVLYAGFKLVSAGASATTEWLSDRFGATTIFALLGPAYGGLFLGVAVAPLVVIPVLFFNRSVRVVIQPLRNQYLNDRLANHSRATVLSGTSMAISIAMGGAKVIAGQLAATMGLLRVLVAAGIVLPLIGGVLWMSVSPVRPLDRPTTTRESTPTD